MALTKVSGDLLDNNISFAGIITATTANFTDVTVSGDLTVQGTTTTLDTVVTEVDKLEVGANNSTVGVAITQSGSGDILRLYDGATQVVTVKDGGSVGVGTDNPTNKLTIYGNNPGILLKEDSANAELLVTVSDSDGTGIIAALRPSNSTYEQLALRGQDLIFETTASQSREERLRITSSGNVGIGTDTPVSSPGYGNLSLVGTTGGQVEFKETTANKASYIYGAEDLNLYTGPGGDIVFYTNGANERARFNSTGNLSFPSGSGIDFSADSNAAGMTSELLDDYEEGTFTPSFGNSSGITYSQQLGRYTKIGNRLIFNIFLTWSANSITGGSVYIGGLPYSVSSVLSNYGAFSFTTNTLTLPSGAYNVVGQIGPPNPTLYIYGAVSGGNKIGTPYQNLGSSGEFIISGQYLVA